MFSVKKISDFRYNVVDQNGKIVKECVRESEAKGHVDDLNKVLANAMNKSLSGRS